jgi:hypothetical protein
MAAIDKTAADNKISPEDAKRLRTETLEKSIGATSGTPKTSDVTERLDLIKHAVADGSIDEDDAKRLGQSVLRSFVEGSNLPPAERDAAAKLIDELPRDAVTRVATGDPDDGATVVEAGEAGFGDEGSGGGGGGGMSTIRRLIEETLLGAAPKGVLQSIDEFERRTAPSAWSQLDRAKVAKRLRQLAADPDVLNQGVMPLCGPATFLNAWGRIDRQNFVGFAINLFDQGVARVGDIVMQPGSGLRGQTPPAGDLRETQADWMLMSALRDWGNDFYDYDGTPGDDGGTWAKELVKWLEESGHFGRVTDGTSASYPGLNEALALDADTSGTVMVFVNADLIDLNAAVPAASNLNHVVGLRGKIEKVNGDVEFRFWTWGDPIVKGGKYTRAHFEKLFFGAIVADKFVPQR